MLPLLAVLAVALFAGGLILLRLAATQRRQAGLPPGRVIYADTGAWDRCQRPLFSARYHLTGRPDYLVQELSSTIPVEVKSAAAPPTPYPSHVLQLAAYCLLIEEEYGQAPPYGILKYRDAALSIDYTPALRAQLLNVLAEMRAALAAKNVARSHEEPNRCRGCGYGDDCRERLPG